LLLKHDRRYKIRYKMSTNSFNLKFSQYENWTISDPARWTMAGTSAASGGQSTADSASMICSTPPSDFARNLLTHQQIKIKPTLMESEISASAEPMDLCDPNDFGLSSIQMERSWKKRLEPEFQKDYMVKLGAFLKAEKEKGRTIFPKGNEFFAAFDFTPFENVKVVILGQDPYHGPDQAHGLCFSVKKGIRQPPSLQNIFKELKQDLGIETPKNGTLDKWAKQGVLLLNSVLTVEQNKAASHSGKGWEQFTDAVIHHLNAERESLIFVLWGSYAQKKGSFIDRKKHLVLESPHPSPLSSYRGFFGSKPFSKINAYLSKQGLTEIDWKL
jgi:uracil-DNA glycosylase